MATIDGSIVIIAMPAIFRGIHLSPLAPGNITYVLWMIMGYLLVQAVLVVTLGRLGDMFGRVKIYNLGFVVFTLASIALSLDPLTGGHARAVADSLASRAGLRRSHADGQLGGDPDRRVPGEAARHGARHQPDRRDLRPVHRPAARRPAGRLGLARGVLGQRAHRRLGHGLGIPQPAGDRHHQRRPGSTGQGTSCSLSVRPACSRRSPMASSPTAATPPAGPVPWSSPA